MFVFGVLYWHFVKLYIQCARIAYFRAREAKHGNTRFLMPPHHVSRWIPRGSRKRNSWKAGNLHAKNAPRTRVCPECEAENGVPTPVRWPSDSRWMAIRPETDGHLGATPMAIELQTDGHRTPGHPRNFMPRQAYSIAQTMRFMRIRRGKFRIFSPHLCKTRGGFCINMHNCSHFMPFWNWQNVSWMQNPCI